MSELVEGARLEIVYTLIAYLGFESLHLRHFFCLHFSIRIQKKGLESPSLISKLNLIPLNSLRIQTSLLRLRIYQTEIMPLGIEYLAPVRPYFQPAHLTSW